MTRRGIGRGDLLHLEPAEYAANGRQDEPPVDPSEDLGQAVEVLDGKETLSVVVFGTPIRRVEIEECRRPVPAVDEAVIGEPLDRDAGETLVDAVED